MRRGGLLAFLLVAVGACASDGAASPDAGVAGCVPGRSVSCVCVGGGLGAQVCNAEGTYDPCACAGDTEVGAGDAAEEATIEPAHDAADDAGELQEDIGPAQDLVSPKDAVDKGDGDSAQDAKPADPNCPPPTSNELVLLGNFTARTVADLAFLQPYTATTGYLGLDLQSGEGETVDLPNMQTVGGGFGVGGSNVTSFALCNLRSVGGNVSFSGSPDLVNLARLETIEGSIVVGSQAAVQAISLPNLRTVRHISVSGDAVQTVSLPALEVVEESVLISGDALTVLAMPELVSVGQDFTLTATKQLAGFDLSGLESVGGVFAARHDEGLKAFVLPSLRTAGAVDVTSEEGLEHFELPALETVAGDLSVWRNQALERFEAGVLDHVDGALIVWEGNALHGFDLSAVVAVGGDLMVSDNVALAEFGFAALTYVEGALTVEDNPALPQCWVDFVLAQVEVGGESKVSGNRPGCVCSGFPVTASCPE